MKSARPPIRFMLADESHDSAIRALLRETSMEGDIAISLQREPSYFAAARIGGSESYTIVAIESDRVICAGSVTVRRRYVNGKLKRVGYLGQLRLASTHTGRFDILRRGYNQFHELHRTLGVQTYFTTIASENLRAIRVLERGLTGFPTYHFVGELVTLAIAAPRGQSVQADVTHDRDAALSFLNEQSAAYQFAPRWTSDQFAGPREDDFILMREADRPIACAALWDQRAYRQVVVSGYSQKISLLRPVYNLIGRVPLPKAGTALSQAYVSHLSCPADRIEALVTSIGGRARSLGIEMLLIGFDARDPRLEILMRRFKPRTYRTRLYTVAWPDAAPVEPLDDRLLYPEVATL